MKKGLCMNACMHDFGLKKTRWAKVHSCGAADGHGVW